PTWQPDNTGLPLFLDGLSAKPFYRDGKIKLSSYGHGVWENELQDQPSAPLCQPQVNRLTYPFSMTCEPDTLQFEDHSILNHAGASWQWSFPGGNPSSSSIRNPRVVYNAPGTYTVTLTVTDSAGLTDSNTLVITVSAFQALANLTEGFQNGVPPQQGWWLKPLTPAIGDWELNTTVGGYGNSTQSAMFNNYYTNVQGDATDMRVRVDMTMQQTSMLRFDVAYAQYNATYNDTLEVLVSTDCGATFTSVYRKGGSQLATAPMTSALFTPDSTQWRTESVSLAAFAGETDLLIAFRDRCYYGQLLYVDNINLSGPMAVAEPTSAASATVYPNPAVSGQSISLLAPEGDRVEVTIYSGEGKLVHRGRYISGENIQLPNLAPGIYVCRLAGETYIRHQRLIIR
ncbi:MAG: PKD domain-containing protein, partial [Bacteroidia bacterium]